MGPRTLLKCNMSGIRLVRKRVSTMTAALVVFLMLKSSPARTMLFAWDLPAPVVSGEGDGSDAGL